MMESETALGANKGGARKLARYLIKRAEITETPVSLQKIIEYLQTRHDLAVIKTDFGKKISGILVMVGNQPTIGFNENDCWYRRRFTIGHEIGHLLMGHTCEGSASNNIHEQEANQFAAELLVPLEFIKKDFLKTKNIPDLSKKYAVSQEALCRHMIECNLI